MGQWVLGIFTYEPGENKVSSFALCYNATPVLTLSLVELRKEASVSSDRVLIIRRLLWRWED